MDSKLHSSAVFNLMQIRFKLMETKRSINNYAYKNADKFILVGGILLIGSAVSTFAFAQGDMDEGPIEQVIQILLNDMIGGSFGALIMIVAGLVAIISSSMGAYRAAMSALVVAVGAFVLRSVVSAFFPGVNIGDQG